MGNKSSINHDMLEEARNFVRSYSKKYPARQQFWHVDQTVEAFIGEINDRIPELLPYYDELKYGEKEALNNMSSKCIDSAIKKDWLSKIVTSHLGVPKHNKCKHLYGKVTIKQSTWSLAATSSLGVLYIYDGCVQVHRMSDLLGVTSFDHQFDVQIFGTKKRESSDDIITFSYDNGAINFIKFTNTEERVIMDGRLLYVQEKQVAQLDVLFEFSDLNRERAQPASDSGSSDENKNNEPNTIRPPTRKKFAAVKIRDYYFDIKISFHNGVSEGAIKKAMKNLKEAIKNSEFQHLRAGAAIDKIEEEYLENTCIGIISKMKLGGMYSCFLFVILMLF